MNGPMTPEQAKTVFATFADGIQVRIARLSILRRLLDPEAQKVQIVIANYSETHELISAALDLETLLRVGPQRLIAGAIVGAAWDEGLRAVRQKIRDLSDALTATAESWKVAPMSREGRARRKAKSEAA